MQIRLAIADDAPAIAAIYEPIVRDTVISFETEPPDSDEIGHRMTTGMPEYPWLVATDNTDVGGYAYASRHRARPAYRWAVDVSVYINGQHQGRGIGRRLYAVLLDLLTAQGYRNAFAGIAMPNPASVALHESLGFEYLGKYERVGWKHDDWHDVGWWQRSLGDEKGRPHEILSLDEIDVGSTLPLTANPGGEHVVP